MHVKSKASAVTFGNDNETDAEGTVEAEQSTVTKLEETEAKSLTGLKTESQLSKKEISRILSGKQSVNFEDIITSDDKIVAKKKGKAGKGKTPKGKKKVKVKAKGENVEAPSDEVQEEVDYANRPSLEARKRRKSRKSKFTSQSALSITDEEPVALAEKSSWEVLRQSDEDENERPSVGEPHLEAGRESDKSKSNQNILKKKSKMVTSKSSGILASGSKRRLSKKKSRIAKEAEGEAGDTQSKTVLEEDEAAEQKNVSIVEPEVTERTADVKKKKGKGKKRRKTSGLQAVASTSESKTELEERPSMMKRESVDVSQARKSTKRAHPQAAGTTRSRSSYASGYSNMSEESIASSSSSASDDEDTKVRKKKKDTLQIASKITVMEKEVRSRTLSKIKKRPTRDDTKDEAEDEEVEQKVTAPAVPSSQTSKTTLPKKKKAKKAAAKKTVAKKKGKPAAAVKTEAQIEAELQREAEEERQRFLEERRAAVAREKRDILEGNMRPEQLEYTFQLMEGSDLALRNLIAEEQAAEEWRQYLVCDGLPAAWDVAGMNTYLHLWEKEINTVTAEQCQTRTAEAINLLQKLEDILDDPFDETAHKCQDWEWVSRRFREHQLLNLEYCTYRLLRDIKNKMNRITIPTADYRIQEELFSMCLYVAVTLPTPAPNPRTASRSRIQLDWPEMKADVLFPSSLKCDMLAIRGMYLKYDHLSDTCPSYKCQNVPAYYSKTMKDCCREELLCKLRYKYDNRVIVPKEPVEVVLEDGTVQMQDPEPTPELLPDEMAPTVPYQKLDPTASEHCLNLINDEMTDALYSLEYVPEGSILNMRKYTVLGGVYYLDLFYQPPQPQGMVSYEVFISTLIEPYKLQTAPFVVGYNPPPPHEAGTRRSPEEIEEELLQQEKELDELIYMTLILPKHVYWMEAPLIAQWDYEQNAWTTNGAFDFKNIEEKGYVTFRTGIFRPFAVATLRWTNLPYQAWEIRPEKDGTVTFQLTCAILTLEFHIRANRVTVKDVQCAPNDAFDQHIGVYYPFSKLRKIMRSIGIDVFPFFDTLNYVDGTCEKYWPMEDHLYFIVALLSVVYNMTWSRWNVTLDFRSIVFQMRVFRFDRPKLANFDTVLVQPMRTLCIDCTEVSAEFSDAPAEGMRFFADLWHLIRSTSTKAIKTKISSADMTMVKTMYRLYRNIRFFSFS